MGSTEKKSWPSGQNERVFARLRPVFVLSKVSCQPWSAPAWRLFRGNIHGFSMAIPYATIARARDSKLIDRYRRCRLSSQSSCLAHLDFSCPVTWDCRKNDNGEEEMAGVRVGIDTFIIQYNINIMLFSDLFILPGKVHQTKSTLRTQSFLGPKKL